MRRRLNAPQEDEEEKGTLLPSSSFLSLSWMYRLLAWDYSTKLKSVAKVAPCPKKRVIDVQDRFPT